MAWPEILAHPFVRETPEQQHARVVLESQVRALPRFFRDSNHEAVSEVKPSVERLRTSGEWKICDPETGRQIRTDDANSSSSTARSETKASETSSAKELEKRLPHTLQREPAESAASAQPETQRHQQQPTRVSARV